MSYCLTIQLSYCFLQKVLVWTLRNCFVSLLLTWNVHYAFFLCLKQNHLKEQGAKCLLFEKLIKASFTYSELTKKKTLKYTVHNV